MRLDTRFLQGEIRRFLAEDIGAGDVTTFRVVPPEAQASGCIVARQDCVIAGLEVARLVFHELDAGIRFEIRSPESSAVSAGTPIAHLEGAAAPILTSERVALNLLQRLSGIATLTRRFVETIAGTGATISDTRKTTPGMRYLEKYAVYIGGGRNHRMGLYDAILIKDNHIAVAGGAAVALQRAQTGAGEKFRIQIEVDRLDQLPEVLDRGADAVLLDNMLPSRVAEAVRLIRQHPRGSTCWIEASGGIGLENVRAYAEAGVDTISIGALTHSVPAVDLALDFESLKPR